MDKTIDTEELVGKAIGFFKQGYNCSQSVAMAFADYYGIPEPLMARFSASFGGGIGRMRETCGSACAMFMLAGLEVQNADDAPEPLTFACNPYPSQQLKKKNYEVVQMLAARFKEVTGSICCRELLQKASIKETAVVATPEARTDEYYKKRPCVRMVETAVRTYAEYLNNKYKNNI